MLNDDYDKIKLGMKIWISWVGEEDDVNSVDGIVTEKNEDYIIVDNCEIEEYLILQWEIIE